MYVITQAPLRLCSIDAIFSSALVRQRRTARSPQTGDITSHLLQCVLA